MLRSAVISQSRQRPGRKSQERGVLASSGSVEEHCLVPTSSRCGACPLGRLLCKEAAGGAPAPPALICTSVHSSCIFV